MKLKLIILLFVALISGTLCSQTTTPIRDSSNLLSRNKDLTGSYPAEIRWTKQLPELVKCSFFKSRFSDWYIEKMIRYESDGKTVYRFIVNNGSLFDGDHHDSFLKTDSVDISDTGTILR